MPSPKSAYPDLPFRFDYEKFNDYLRQAGGIDPVCRRAGTTRHNLYDLTKRDILPVFDSILRLCAVLEIPLPVFRSLFIEKPPAKKRKP